MRNVPSLLAPARVPRRFVGRGSELQRLAELSAEAPLVLVRGDWGVGKSAFVSAHVQRLRKRDGELPVLQFRTARAASRGELKLQMSRQLGLLSEDSEDAIAEALSTHLSPAVVLDDCSALDEGARSFLQSLVQSLPTASFVCVATSRLGIGEEVFELGGLQTEASASELSEAGTFLKAQMAAHHGSSDSSIAELNHLAEFFAGNPLALTLAASMSAVLTPQAIVEALQHGEIAPTVSTPQGSGLLSRFYELHWSRLREPEQSELLRAASAPSGLPVPTTPERVSLALALEAQGLLRTENAYLKVPEFIRAFVLAVAPERRAEAERAWVSELGRDLGRYERVGDPASWSWIRREEENIERAAHLVQSGRVQADDVAGLVLALCEYRLRFGRMSIELPRSLAMRCQDLEQRVQLLFHSAFAAAEVGNQPLFFELVDQVEPHLDSLSGQVAQRVLVLVVLRASMKRKHDDVDRIAALPSLEDPVLCEQLAVHRNNQGQDQNALEFLEKGRKTAKRQGDRILELRCAYKTALTYASTGRYDDARRELDILRAGAEELGLNAQLAHHAFIKAKIDLAVGDTDAVGRSLSAATHHLKRAGNRSLFLRAMLKCYQGDAACITGGPGAAREIYAEAAQLARSAGWSLFEGAVGLRLAGLDGLEGNDASSRIELSLELMGNPERTEGHVACWLRFCGQTAERSHKCVNEWDISDQVWRAARSGNWGEGVVGDRAWRVGPASSWLESPAGERTHFRRSSPMRYLLEALVLAHQEDPQKIVASEDLMEFAWPDQKIDKETIQRRLWTSMRRFRSMGLEDELQQVGPGYRLAPTISLVLESV